MGFVFFCPLDRTAVLKGSTRPLRRIPKAIISATGESMQPTPSDASSRHLVFSTFCYFRIYSVRHPGPKINTRGSVLSCCVVYMSVTAAATAAAAGVAEMGDEGANRVCPFVSVPACLPVSVYQALSHLSTKLSSTCLPVLCLQVCLFAYLLPVYLSLLSVCTIHLRY